MAGGNKVRVIVLIILYIAIHAFNGYIGIVSISDTASDATLLKVCNIVLPILALTLLTCGWVSIAVGVVLLICEIFLLYDILLLLSGIGICSILHAIFYPLYLIVVLIVAVVYK